MKTIFTFLILLISFQILGKSYFLVSENTSIGLITTAPGDELYSSFGHSAIRIKDTLGGFDLVFNYGAFDFNEEGFYTNFVRGKLNYYLVIENMTDFISVYQAEKREVIQNKLNLNVSQKQKIFDYLMSNAEIQNRQYKYDFFYNNCATKIRDVFESQIGSAVRLDYSSKSYQRDKSIRDMLDLYISDKPLIKLSFYLILGINCDVIATNNMQTFIPEYLQVSFKNGQNNNRPLAQKDEIIFKPTTSTPKEIRYCLYDYILPLSILIGITVLLIAGLSIITDTGILIASGALGCFFFFMWAFTDHESCSKNLNLLWALPFNLILTISLINKKSWVSNYLKIYGFWLLGVFVISFVLPQPFHVSVRASILIVGLYFAFKKHLLALVRLPN